MVHAPLDVLGDDDGVVDDEADGQHQRQQGQQVQREAERRQHHEGGEQADRATTVGITAARRVPRKTKLTSATRASAMPIVIHTSWMASEVNSEASEATMKVEPGGRPSRTCLHRLAHALRDLEVVRLGLPGDGDADLVLARCPRNMRRRSLGALLDLGDVAEAGDVGGRDGAARDAVPEVAQRRIGRRSEGGANSSALR
jgi:hypothetical protein